MNSDTGKFLQLLACWVDSNAEDGIDSLSRSGPLEVLLGSGISNHHHCSLNCYCIIYTEVLGYKICTHVMYKSCQNVSRVG